MNRYLGYLSFGISIVIYLLTLSGEVTFFDSGELITSSYTFGIAHPPGYPIYIILSHFFNYIPLGSVAFRVSLFSAFCSASTNFITFLIVKELIEKDDFSASLIALISSLIIGFSYTHWSQSVVTEVYSLSTFLIVLTIYLNIKFVKNTDLRLIFLACFFTGIAITAHLTALVLIPIILFSLLYRDRKLLFDIKNFSVGIFFLLLGLSVFLHLPMRAWQREALIWGDPKNLSQFLWVLLRKGYEIEGPERTFSLFIQQMSSFNLIREFSVLFVFFGILGFLAGFRKYFYFTVITSIVLLVLNVGVVLYGNPIPENIFLLESFHTPGYVMFAIFSSFGIYFFSKLMSRLFKNNILVLLVISITSISYLLYFNYTKNDWSNYHIARDYGKNVLKSCDRNSALFTWGDSGAFPLWYLQRVEKYRDDVVLLHTPHLDAYWYWNEKDKINLVDKRNIRLMFETNEGPEWMVRFLVRQLVFKMPVHLDYSTKYSVSLPGMFFIPDGIVYTYSETPRLSNYNLFDSYVIRGLKDFDELKDLDTEKAVSIYGYSLFDNGLNLISNNKKEEGKELIKKAVDLMPQLKFQAIGVLGENLK
ncbi:MAG: DUF2723 domain-containing protein [Proteobacteria bacterium]|nr:DUF2723 domain-containing protein [Pseudomonadota bacterium]